MKILKTITLRWWQIGIVKLCLISFGIIVGVYFKEFFLKWIVVVTIIFVLTAIYLIKDWWKQNNNSNTHSNL